MVKLTVYVPASHLEAVKCAMFDAGAGRIGDYEHCCWQVAGQGQFRPLEGSSPFVGSTDQLEVVEEYRVEMVCTDELVSTVVRAMKSAHPYEEPAYDAIQVLDI